MATRTRTIAIGTSFEIWRETWAPYLPPKGLPVETCMRIAYMAGCDAAIRHFAPMDTAVRKFNQWADPVGYELIDGWLEHKRDMEAVIVEADGAR